MRGLSAGLGLGLNGAGGGEPWFQQLKADGQDPSMVADFVNNRYAVNGVETPFADIFTFTRASTATYFNASGVMQTAAVNAPRFDYDPVTLLPRGLLLEEQRTNVLKYSKSPITHWFGVGATTSAASGSMLGYFSGGITVTSAGATWNRSRPDNISWTNAVVQSWTAFVKAGTSGKIRINFNDTIAVTETSMSGNLGAVLTATATAAGAVTHDKTVSLGGGFYILSGTFTPNSTMVGQGQFAVGPNSAVVGETIDLFGAQFEAGAFPTSFIETTTAAVTRSYDNPLSNSGNVVPFASWYNTAGSGTIFTVFSKLANDTIARRIYDSDTSNGVGLLHIASTTTLQVNDGGVALFTHTLAPPVVNAKHAYAFASGDHAGSLNGAAVVTSSAGLTHGGAMIYGNRFTDNLRTLSGHIKEFRYYPARITNATLQTLTT